MGRMIRELPDSIRPAAAVSVLCGLLLLLPSILLVILVQLPDHWGVSLLIGALVGAGVVLALALVICVILAVIGVAIGFFRRF